MKLLLFACMVHHLKDCDLHVPVLYSLNILMEKIWWIFTTIWQTFYFSSLELLHVKCIGV